MTICTKIQVQDKSLQQVGSDTLSAHCLSLDLSLCSCWDMDVQDAMAAAPASTDRFTYACTHNTDIQMHTRTLAHPRMTSINISLVYLIVSSTMVLPLETHTQPLLPGHFICSLASLAWSLLVVTHSHTCTWSSSRQHGHMGSYYLRSHSSCWHTSTLWSLQFLTPWLQSLLTCGLTSVTDTQNLPLPLPSTVNRESVH